MQESKYIVSTAQKSVARCQVCLCGHCAERLSARAVDLRAQAHRLALASFRSLDRRDGLRAAAYARQAGAATAEATQCERSLLASNSPRVLNWFASALAAVLCRIASLRCSRLPQRWPTYFA